MDGQVHGVEREHAMGVIGTEAEAHVIDGQQLDEGYPRVAAPVDEELDIVEFADPAARLGEDGKERHGHAGAALRADALPLPGG